MSIRKPSFRSKGQSSIEFLSVVGIALVISAPFILSAQQSMVDMQMNSRMLELQESLNRMEKGVQMVSSSGEPARITFLMRVPDDVLQARVVQDRAVVYTVRTRGGKTNLSRVFDTTIAAPEGLPESTGRLRLEAWNGQVNISVVE